MIVSPPPVPNRLGYVEVNKWPGCISSDFSNSASSESESTCFLRSGSLGLKVRRFPVVVHSFV
jgi:hypothetical protein